MMDLAGGVDDGDEDADGQWGWGWMMGMCHQLQGTVKASRAKIGTWTTKWLKLPICREFERER